MQNNINDLTRENLNEFIKIASEELFIAPEVYCRVVKISFPQSEQDISLLEKAIEGSRFEDIGTLAHRLKGVYANLRLHELSVPAEEIDLLAKTGDNIARIKNDFLSLKPAFIKIKELFSNT